MWRRSSDGSYRAMQAASALIRLAHYQLQQFLDIVDRIDEAANLVERFNLLAEILDILKPVY